MQDNPYNRIPLAEGTWAVICLGRPTRDADLPPSFDPNVDDGLSPELATSSGFKTRRDAVRYAQTINPSWRPVIAKLEGVKNTNNSRRPHVPNLCGLCGKQPLVCCCED